ncbi:MAG: hypothetical protein WA093_04315 [Minisyncoccales bacterium]
METKTIGYLNNKVWYRLLKVLFFLSFIIVFLLVNFMVWALTDNEKISDKTFIEVGRIIKQEYPAYSDMDDLDVGRNIYQKRRYDEWEKYTIYGEESSFIPTYGKRVNGIDFHPTTNLEAKIKIEYTPESLWKKISYNIFSSIIILVIFWIISRVFFYIVLGTFLPKKK